MNYFEEKGYFRVVTSTMVISYSRLQMLHVAK